jgi:hypothetical protein
MDLDHDIAIGCAFRYALGRMTYVVDSVASVIESDIEEISTKTLHLIRKEIEEAIKASHAGMQMDVERWSKCRIAINDELHQRHRETTTMS